MASKPPSFQAEGLEMVSLCVPRSRSGQERRCPGFFTPFFVRLRWRSSHKEIQPEHRADPQQTARRRATPASVLVANRIGRRDARDTVAALLFWLLLAVSLGIIIVAGHGLNHVGRTPT
jgi:hypothetical protein